MNLRTKSVTTHAPREVTWITSLGRVLLVAGALLGLLSCCWVCWLRIHASYQIDYGEGVVLNSGLRMLRGQSIYGPPTTFSSQLSPYGPVGYALGSAGALSRAVPLAAPRALVFGIAILTSVFIGLIIAEFSNSRELAFAFAALYLSAPLVQHWASLLRVDFAGVLLSLAGVYFFLRDGRWRSFAYPLFLGALLAKWSFIAAPAACFLYLLSCRQWKQAVKFAGINMAMLAGTVAVAQRVTGGWFAWHMFRTHPDPFSLPSFVLEIQRLLLNIVVPFCAAFSFVFAFGDERDPRGRLLKFYLVLAVVIVPFSGKIGAHTNYFLELIALFCVCGALGYTKFRAETPGEAVLLLGAVLLGAGLICLNSVRDRSLVGAVTHRGCDAAYQFVGQFAGDSMVSENITALIAGGKPVLLNDPFMYRQMVQSGRLPEFGLVAGVKARQFSLILLSKEALDPNFLHFRWSREFSGAVRANYAVRQQFDCLDAAVALVPRE